MEQILTVHIKKKCTKLINYFFDISKKRCKIWYYFLEWNLNVFENPFEVKPKKEF